MPRELTLDGLDQLVGFVSRIESAALAELRGVSPDRAHQVPAGAVVAATAMRLAARTVRADLSVGAARGCHPPQAGLVGRSVMAEPDWNPGHRRTLARRDPAGGRHRVRQPRRPPPLLGRPRGDRHPPAAGRGGRRRTPRAGAAQERPVRRGDHRSPSGARRRSGARPPSGGRPPTRARCGGDPSRARPRRRSRGCARTASPASPSSGRCPAVPCRPAGPPSRPRSARPSARRSAVAPVESHPQTGPIPVVRPEQFDDDLADADDLDATPQESALAWLRFAGELIIALAAGRRRLLRGHRALGDGAARRRPARAPGGHRPGRRCRRLAAAAGP